jgi:uncharacterized protein YbaP (TraB family)
MKNLINHVYDNKEISKYVISSRINGIIEEEIEKLETLEFQISMIKELSKEQVIEYIKYFCKEKFF